MWLDIVHYFPDLNWFERIIAEERQRQKQCLKELEEVLAAKEAGADQLIALTAGIMAVHMRQKLQNRMNEVGG